ncbi:hypothetical protein K1719_037486 [Acacia pycnantha]|nr:hypothetical protein K1719_037486 [Acacia pycnantha]
MSYRVNGFTSTALFSTCRKPQFRRYFSCWKHLEMEERAANSDPELIVGYRDSLANKIASIRSAGPQKLQVIADFDATLTKFWVNGTRGQSSHGLVQQGNPEYDSKREELYDYYHPLEFSPDIGLEEKTKLMEEWWGRVHVHLIEGGFTKESIIQSVANGNIAFREGVFELYISAFRGKRHSRVDILCRTW